MRLNHSTILRYFCERATQLHSGLVEDDVVAPTLEGGSWRCVPNDLSTTVSGVNKAMRWLGLWGVNYCYALHHRRAIMFVRGLTARVVVLRGVRQKQLLYPSV